MDLFLASAAGESRMTARGEAMPNTGGCFALSFLNS
jgi:hypothetical protein